MALALAEDSEEVVCQFCKELTPSEYNFCVVCDSQTKCLECGKKTFPGKDYCLSCSKPLVVKKNGSQAPNHYLRTVEQDGDKRKEHTEFSLSDKSVAEIAPFVVAQILPDNRIGDGTVALPPAADEIETSATDVTPKSNADDASTAETPKAENPTANTDKLRFFTEDSGVLVATTKDFKGKTWSEQQKNFLVLYCFFYKLVFGKPVPSDDHLRSAAEKVDIVDKNNFTTYLKGVHSSYLMPITGGFQLNDDGIERAKTIITLLDNKQAPEGEKYWLRNKSTSAPATPRIKDEDKKKAEAWASEKVELGKLDVLELKMAREYAMFAIWSITVALKKGESVKSSEAYHYLTTKYANISVKSEAFLKAINNNKPRYFDSNQLDGSCYLTKFGKQCVEDWVSGKAKPSAAEAQKS
ncbi:zinc ribbon domain-containing protein [Hymenobacter armeniacus]|uniref:Zinc ribbon domain-containing protein n=1 Tax=Hymenobacter armeniacus TaxID=2771358 RepID=A0ABR8JV26_9BACT|nr:zinc ribbon domain-containing protein [Hymenobacter armeniacus]MBD2723817.1 zinc ribbon domain-containing protein [Hymenobacter armeniacus]